MGASVRARAATYHFDAIAIRQAEIRDDKIRPLIPDALDRFSRVDRLHVPHAIGFKRESQNSLELRLIFNDENQRRSARHVFTGICDGRSTGKRTVNSAPPSGRLRAVSVSP